MVGLAVEKAERNGVTGGEAVRLCKLLLRVGFAEVKSVGKCEHNGRKCIQHNSRKCIQHNGRKGTLVSVVDSACGRRIILRDSPG